MAEYDCETTYIAPREIGIAKSSDGTRTKSIDDAANKYGEETLVKKVSSPWQCAVHATNRLEDIWDSKLKNTKEGPYTSDDMPMMRFKVKGISEEFARTSGLINLSEGLKNGDLLRCGPQVQASGLTDSGGYVAVYEGKGLNEPDRAKFASKPICGM